MKKNEFFLILGVTILCYVWYFICKCVFPAYVLNIVLLSFYVMFSLGILPHYFYPENHPKTNKTGTLMLYSGILFLVCCLFSFIFPRYMRFIGRIGMSCLVVFTAGSMSVIYLRRLFGSLSTEEFKTAHMYLFRVIFILFANIYMLPICAYSYKASYSGSGKLVSKEIIDGLNRYNTQYVDSFSCYVTHAIIGDSDEKGIKYLEYKIYYEKYPDKISHVDTIKVVRNKKVEKE